MTVWYSTFFSKSLPVVKTWLFLQINVWVQVEDQSPVEDSRLQSEIADAVKIRSYEKL